jgi:hypothetical protein
MDTLICCVHVQIPSGLPRNLEAALLRYGSSSYKASAITVLDPSGKPSLNLSYGGCLAAVVGPCSFFLYDSVPVTAFSFLFFKEARRKI